MHIGCHSRFCPVLSWLRLWRGTLDIYGGGRWEGREYLPNSSSYILRSPVDAFINSRSAFRGVQVVLIWAGGGSVWDLEGISGNSKSRAAETQLGGCAESFRRAAPRRLCASEHSVPITASGAHGGLDKPNEGRHRRVNANRLFSRCSQWLIDEISIAPIILESKLLRAAWLVYLS